MFTGIIEGTGTVRGVSGGGRGSAARLEVDLGAAARGLKRGESVAIDGACLTVVSRSGGSCAFELVGETVRRTTLGSLRAGDSVNVERSLRAGARLEGHFVLGHVDGVGRIASVERLPDEARVWVAVPKGLARHIVEKGSVAVDGVSLTVTGTRAGAFSVSLIPHTLEATGLGAARKGDRVNVETDILGKYALGRLPE